MSGYVKLSTNSDDDRIGRNESDVDDSEAEASDHDCASFADNEDNQESPLIGTTYFLVYAGDSPKTITLVVETLI